MDLVGKFAEEHHLHLYGCLDAEDLWEIGKTAQQTCESRLDWYALEFEKAYGRRPDWQAYWSHENGLELLSNDYYVGEGSDFSRFQASFNLVIALCKIIPDSTMVIRKVLSKLAGQGLRYAELRFVIPQEFDDHQVELYLGTMADEVANFGSDYGTFEARLALSLPREEGATVPTYQKLRKWLDANKDRAYAFTAVDLAFYEENDPPKNKFDFINLVQKDNKKTLNPLAILYHVGESFRTISLASSVRWVQQVASRSVTRIGHAISLGVEPTAYEGQLVLENVLERKDHLNWLIDNENWLREFGYTFDGLETKHELAELEAVDSLKKETIVYDRSYLEEIRRLQDAVLAGIHADFRSVIETCPTSNMRILGLGKWEYLPVKRFAESGISLCVSSDDPGVFQTNLHKEVSLLKNRLNVSEPKLATLAENQTRLRSANLLRSS